MDMVPLKATGADMPVVYAMEPKQSVALQASPSATLLSQLEPSNLDNLPVSVAFPLPNGIIKAVKPSSQATKRPAKMSQPQHMMPVPTAREIRFESAYPVETEAQAVKRAKMLAQQDYMKTYETAIEVGFSQSKYTRTP